jgi:hypothetical protein
MRKFIPSSCIVISDPLNDGSSVSTWQQKSFAKSAMRVQQNVPRKRILQQKAAQQTYLQDAIRHRLYPKMLSGREPTDGRSRLALAPHTFIVTKDEIVRAHLVAFVLSGHSRQLSIPPAFHAVRKSFRTVRQSCLFDP